MKIKCVKTAIKKDDPYITNGNMDGYLSIGDQFWVYGISFFKKVAYFYIPRDKNKEADKLVNQALDEGVGLR